MDIYIDLETDKIFNGCYDSDKEQWDLSVREEEIESIPTDIYVSMDAKNGEPYWHCYLDKVKWQPKTMTYELTYKEY